MQTSIHDFRFRHGVLYMTRDEKKARWNGKWCPEFSAGIEGRTESFVFYDQADQIIGVSSAYSDGALYRDREAAKDIIALWPKLAASPLEPLVSVPASSGSPESILQEAERLITKDRNAEYGDARLEFERVALLWTAVIGCVITGRQVGLCMALLKIAREIHKHKRDNLVDACGYLQLTNDCEERK